MSATPSITDELERLMADSQKLQQLKEHKRAYIREYMSSYRRKKAAEKFPVSETIQPPTVANEIEKLIADSEKLRQLKERKRLYQREYMLIYQRKQAAEKLGVSYDEYVSDYLPKLLCRKKQNKDA